MNCDKITRSTSGNKNQFAINPYSFIFCLFIFIFHCQSDELPTRGYLGFTWKSGINGIEIQNILPESAAAEAGLQKGDILLAVGEQQISSEEDISGGIPGLISGKSTTAVIMRDGVQLSPKITPTGLLQEDSTEIDIIYTHFSSEGIRLRTVLTRPPSFSEHRKYPAVFLVRALGSSPIRSTGQYSSERELAHYLSANGFIVMRFELPGSGDSEGNDYREDDFETEISHNMNGLFWLKQQSGVSADQVFVYGHSTGGLIAGYLGANGNPAGLILSCTIGRTFAQRMTDTISMQAALSGLDSIGIQQRIQLYNHFWSLISVGLEKEDILRLLPEATKLFNRNGRIFDDRTTVYWKQLAAIIPDSIWSEIKCPTLLLYAGSDFLTSWACHAHIRFVMSAAGNHNVRLETIKGADHKWAIAKNRTVSFRNYQSGNFRLHPQFLPSVYNWLINES